MEKIRTLHPKPTKRGVNIGRAKFDLIKSGIQDVNRARESMKSMKLFDSEGAIVKRDFFG